MMKHYKEKAVIVKGVYKTFRLPHEQHSGIKQRIINVFKGIKGYETLKILNNISFEIEKGEFFGIVGRNGSGKSTLLKLLAEIYIPDTGLIKINGSLTPFIELGVGFNPELTGRENVFLNGALLGFSKTEMDLMFDQIVEFAELENFMDQKLKNYSSGMQVRLAFSIAIRANTPVLLVDEVLAVGDSEFQRKCYIEFRRMKEEGRTIIFVTHDMSAVEKFCDRVLVLKDGKIAGIYNPSKAAAIYQRMNISDDQPEDASIAIENWGTGDVVLDDVKIYEGNSKHDTDNIVSQGNDVSFDIKFINKNQPKDIVVGLAFKDIYGVNLSGPNSLKIKLNSSSNVIYKVPKLAFVPGVYTLTVAIFDKNAEIEYFHSEEAMKFNVINEGQEQYGKVNLFGQWNQS
ncbi:MAG: ABC transporter ATP-binding protein [Candidatus Saccharibacteria bacterium]